jgi:hypothetical protein
MRKVIIGRGVAGAVRAVSQENAAFPTHAEGGIPEESILLVATEEMFRASFEIDVRACCEAVSISPGE